MFKEGGQRRVYVAPLLTPTKPYRGGLLPANSDCDSLAKGAYRDEDGVYQIQPQGASKFSVIQLTLCSLNNLEKPFPISVPFSQNGS